MIRRRRVLVYGEDEEDASALAFTLNLQLPISASCSTSAIQFVSMLSGEQWGLVVIQNCKEEQQTMMLARIARKHGFKVLLTSFGGECWEDGVYRVNKSNAEIIRSVIFLSRSRRGQLKHDKISA